MVQILEKEDLEYLESKGIVPIFKGLKKDFNRDFKLRKFKLYDTIGSKLYDYCKRGKVAFISKDNISFDTIDTGGDISFKVKYEEMEYDSVIKYLMRERRSKRLLESE